MSKVKNSANIARNCPKRNILFTNFMQFKHSKAYACPHKRPNYYISRVMFASDNAQGPDSPGKRQR